MDFFPFYAFFFFLSVRAFLGENCLSSTPSLNSTPSLSGVDPVPASRGGLMSQVQLMRAMPFLLPQWMDEKQIWNKCGIQARPRRIVPGDFLFPLQKWGLLASEDAKLIQYNTVAAILLPGGKILSENEANLKMSRDGKRQILCKTLALGSSNAQRHISS